MADDLDQYLSQLSRLTKTTDPTLPSPESIEIKSAATELAALPNVRRETLAEAISEHPEWVPTLGLVIGLSQEKLKNALKYQLGSSGWLTLARTRAAELIAMLDEEYDLVRLLEKQRGAAFDFGDVLVARGGTKVTAAGAASAGRLVEDAIEAVALELGLECEARTQFEGRNGRTAPCDLAIPAGGSAAAIVVAAKGFDSTGSKLTDAVREVEEMADVRRPGQYVMAAVDGIGWLSRKNDLRRIHDLVQSHAIDGMYSMTTLDAFARDLEDAARRIGLLERHDEPPKS